jgi:hypothetical protein
MSSFAGAQHASAAQDKSRSSQQLTGEAPVSASVFGSIERLIGAIECVSCRIIRQQRGNTARYRDGWKWSAVRVKLQLRNGDSHFLHHGHGVLYLGAAKNHDEFLAAEARQEIRATKTSGETVRHGT